MNLEPKDNYEVSFAVSKEDRLAIDNIAERMVALDRTYGTRRMLGPDIKKVQLMMSLTACHANGCPLKLDELLLANDADFAHDAFGICRNINTTTGGLDNCFWPRYAVPMSTGGEDSNV
jgi:hypothetical protein